jgi:hypothetical protein
MAGGVSIITTVHGTLYRGATVTACIAASIDPFQFLVSIEHESQMEDWIQSSGVFAFNMLPWSEQFLADQFAGFTPLASTSSGQPARPFSREVSRGWIAVSSRRSEPGTTPALWERQLEPAVAKGGPTIRCFTSLTGIAG